MESTKRAWGGGLVALAVALGTVAAAAPSWGAPAKTGGSLSAEVGGNLPEGFGPWTGDPVKFQIDAQGTPGATTGTFKAFHGKGTSGEVVGDFEGDITCLITAGEVAVATGVITHGHVTLPGQETRDVTGQKVSFTAHDNERSDRIFWMWEFLGAPINDCQGTAPIFEPSYGKLKVRD